MIAELVHALRLACADCDPDNGTRNGYTCGDHRDLIVDAIRTCRELGLPSPVERWTAAT